MELSEQIKVVKSSFKKLEFYYQELESKLAKYCGELDKSVHEAKKAIGKLEAATLESEAAGAGAEDDFEPKQPPKPEPKEDDNGGDSSGDDEATESEAPKTAWPGPTVE